MQLAASAGVHTIPGYKGVVENVEHALKIGKRSPSSQFEVEQL